MRTLLTYATLVGLPVLGVIGVLRAGRGLEAAPYVGGTWAVTLTPESGCAAAGPGVDTMLVVQSGPYIEVALGPARLRGRAHGQYFRARAHSDLQVEASVKQGADSIRGYVSGRPCAAARRTRLLGVRVMDPTETVSH